jgi:hypothetical protein
MIHYFCRTLYIVEKYGTAVQGTADNTGRFIMYSGITKIYYRKTVGHVFTKTVRIKGTTQKRFSH